MTLQEPSPPAATTAGQALPFIALPYEVMERILNPDPSLFQPRLIIERMRCPCGWKEVRVPVEHYFKFVYDSEHGGVKCRSGHTLSKGGLVLS